MPPSAVRSNDDSSGGRSLDDSHVPWIHLKEFPPGWSVPQLAVGIYVLNDTDQSSLMPGGWVTDNIINSFIALQFYNPPFEYSSAVQVFEAHVLQAVKNDMTLFRRFLEQPDILERMWVFPNNAGGAHWNLFIVLPMEETIIILDSMTKGQFVKTNELRCLMQLIMLAFHVQKGPEVVLSRWSVRRPDSIQAQRNSDDCGVHAMVWANIIASGRQIRLPTNQDSAAARMWIAERLVDTEKHGKPPDVPRSTAVVWPKPNAFAASAAKWDPEECVQSLNDLDCGRESGICNRNRLVRARLRTPPELLKNMDTGPLPDDLEPHNLVATVRSRQQRAAHCDSGDRPRENGSSSSSSARTHATLTSTASEGFSSISRAPTLPSEDAGVFDERDFTLFRDLDTAGSPEATESLQLSFQSDVAGERSLLTDRLLQHRLQLVPLMRPLAPGGLVTSTPLTTAASQKKALPPLQVAAAEARRVDDWKSARPTPPPTPVASAKLFGDARYSSDFEEAGRRGRKGRAAQRRRPRGGCPSESPLVYGSKRFGQQHSSLSALSMPLSDEDEPTLPTSGALIGRDKRLDDRRREARGRAKRLDHRGREAQGEEPDGRAKRRDHRRREAQGEEQSDSSPVKRPCYDRHSEESDGLIPSRGKGEYDNRSWSEDSDSPTSAARITKKRPPRAKPAAAPPKRRILQPYSGPDLRDPRPKPPPKPPVKVLKADGLIKSMGGRGFLTDFQQGSDLHLSATIDLVDRYERRKQNKKTCEFCGQRLRYSHSWSLHRQRCYQRAKTPPSPGIISD